MVARACAASSLRGELRGAGLHRAVAVRTGVDGRASRFPGSSRRQEGTCATDDDCPHSWYTPWHSTAGPGTRARSARRTRSAGARRGPGAVPRGDVRELTAKTHVFDVASKAWALPYVHRAARGDDKRRLEALMARMRAAEPAIGRTSRSPGFLRAPLKKEEWHGDCPSGQTHQIAGGVAARSLVVVPVNRRGFIGVMFGRVAGEIAARVGAQVALPRLRRARQGAQRQPSGELFALAGTDIGTGRASSAPRPWSRTRRRPAAARP